jgi:hypothetical protein
LSEIGSSQIGYDDPLSLPICKIAIGQIRIAELAAYTESSAKIAEDLFR